MKDNNLKKQLEVTIKTLKKYFDNNNFKNVVIGLSGGIDSSVSLNILNQAFSTRNIFAYFIDIESQKQDYLDAQLVASSLGIRLQYVNLTKVYKKMTKELKNNTKQSLGNIKSRLRMIYLYDQAMKHQALVCGNCNLDELYLGYFTKYGDNACDFFLLNNFSKSDIYELANYFNVPKRIINKEPSAGLYLNQTDEKELNLKYDDIDNFLNNKKISKSTKERIELLHNQNKHKLFYNYDINKWEKYKNVWKRKK